jgi:Putative adhesin
MGRAADPPRRRHRETGQMLIRRFPARGRAVGGCLAVVVAAGAMTAGCQLQGPESERSSSYQVTEKVTQLVVQDAAGDVHVSVGTEPAIGVTEHQTYRDSAPDSSHAVSNGTLTLTYLCPSGSCGIDYTVTVPAGLAVQVDAAAGDVTLSDLGGDVQVQADAGDIRASGLGSPRAKLVASAGDVTLGYTAAPANLSVQASAGNVKVTLPGTVGYAVTATADAGSTHVTVPTSPGSAHVVKAESDAGDVSVLEG